MVTCVGLGAAYRRCNCCYRRHGPPSAIAAAPRPAYGIIVIIQAEYRNAGRLKPLPQRHEVSLRTLSRSLVQSAKADFVPLWQRIYSPEFIPLSFVLIQNRRDSPARRPSSGRRIHNNLKPAKRKPFKVPPMRFIPVSSYSNATPSGSFSSNHFFAQEEAEPCWSASLTL